MPAPIFLALGNLAVKGVQAAGKSISAGWKAGKVGVGNQIAGNTTTLASYGSSTLEPQPNNQQPDNKNNMLYLIIAGVAVVVFFFIKKK